MCGRTHLCRIGEEEEETSDDPCLLLYNEEANATCIFSGRSDPLQHDYCEVEDYDELQDLRKDLSFGGVQADDTGTDMARRAAGARNDAKDSWKVRCAEGQGSPHI